MVEDIYDVVLQSTGNFIGDIREWEKAPPPRGNFQLEQDFWIGHLPYKVASSQIFDACEPSGFNFRPTRQYGCRYAFCRKVEVTKDDYYAWDSENCIGRTLFLSRLIHPTTIASHFSARLYFKERNLETIVPGRTSGYGTHVWVVASEWRDWLSLSEAEELRTYSKAYILNAPDRVRRARRHIDHAFHAFYLDQRCASVVTSFESLLKTSRENVSIQFRSRVPRLADSVGLTISQDEAKSFYDDRSIFVHGAEPSYTEISKELIHRYNKFEIVLRRSLLRASTDAQFSQRFATEADIEQAFGS